MSERLTDTELDALLTTLDVFSFSDEPTIGAVTLRAATVARASAALRQVRAERDGWKERAAQLMAGTETEAATEAPHE
jgi:hypothetical protein